MRVFLTGATGFVGSRIIPELLTAGHEVVGLTRSESGRRQLEAAGVRPHLGAIEDLESLRTGAAQADAVIHTAFDHDFANYAANCEKDHRVITALGAALQGSDRPLIVTSATVVGDSEDGEPALETVFNAAAPIPRVATEIAARSVLASGVDVRIIRLSQVHDPVRQGLISFYVDHARASGFAGYVGAGDDRWAAAHVSDVGRMFAAVLERGSRGETYHAVGEPGVPFRKIAEAVAAGLDLPLVSLSPAEAEAHFGWLAMFIGRNGAASNDWTRARLGWEPKGPGLIADLQAMDYGRASPAP
ncbi:NAD-dependent dehydratase [Porphyrobacter sp. TH134]|uniref:SDR family oxidoreductase n=1 Tax=Porphyrobacter sp. TH134 TaxID=2067450 RepID=UPI000C7E0C7E|nr:SDR family oxidoreductase [Porphyrobacter sp. TH134]PLK23320.1 NAD-dependent dehydratase [Porphyrobacter sp. TH134]